MSLRVGDLFSGIGGFSLAAESMGWETVFFSEVDRYASAVLAARFPGVPNLGDITAIDWTAAPAVDVLVGGFPCQDISNAGKRLGIGGARSGLWSEYARAIRHLRPRYVVVENVSALLTRGLEQVLGDLAQLGYDASWEVLSAADVGAPHLRERVWIVATPSPFPDALSYALRLEWEREREQHPQPRAAQPREDGTLWLLADADSRGLPEHGSERQRPAHPDLGSSPVADADGGRCNGEPELEREGPPGGGRVSEDGEALAHAHQFEDRRFHGGRPDETPAVEPTGGGATLADADRAGFQLTQESDSRRERHGGRDAPGGGSDEPRAVPDTAGQRCGQRGERYPGSVDRNRLAPGTPSPDASGQGLPLSEQQTLFRAGRWHERGAITERDWWAVEPNVGRVAHGVPARVDRLKCLGNAIVPACALPPFRAIEATR